MTVKALLLIAGTSNKPLMHLASDKLDGSEEIEFTTAYDVFVRAGFEPTICGVELKQSSFATYVATRPR